jgi:DNA-binding response OmpR family regulator
MKANYTDDTTSLPNPLPSKIPIYGAGAKNLCACCQRALSMAGANIFIDTDMPLVLWKGMPVNLTPGEVRIVEFLVSMSGRVATYQRIYSVLKGRENFHCHDTGANVRSQIKRIRKQFQAVDATFVCIVNVATVGYRWQP